MAGAARANALNSVHRLDIGEAFGRLSAREKLYTHHLAKAAFYGARIILLQTSPEACNIFDFIREVHQACDGRWDTLPQKCRISPDDVQAFLEYAGKFMSRLGNYHGEGNWKFVPDLPRDVLQKLASVSPSAGQIFAKLKQGIYAVPPFCLGFPDGSKQSNYYPGDDRLGRGEIIALASLMQKHGVEPHNTRLRKSIVNEITTVDVLIASSVTDSLLRSTLMAQEMQNRTGERLIRHLSPRVRMIRGDHCDALSNICRELERAIEYAPDAHDVEILRQHITSFKYGSLKPFRKAQQALAKRISPQIENMMGFFEISQDPAGFRAAWTGLVAIIDQTETNRLRQVAEKSVAFIKTLPWAVPGLNDGKGPFEETDFQPPSIMVVHGLAHCSSVGSEIVTMPIHDDILDHGKLRTAIVANRLTADRSLARDCFYIRPDERDGFRNCAHTLRYITTATNQIVGRGTGKLLRETALGKQNFNIAKCLLDPLTNQPIRSWYKPGQTYLSVFGDIASSVEACRTALVSYFLIDDEDLMSIFGYSSSTSPSSFELLYYTFVNIGIRGLQALHSFDVDQQAWLEGQKRADFAILRHLIEDGAGVLRIELDTCTGDLTVIVEPSKILPHGKPALGRLLCKLHVWKCSADSQQLRSLYERLTGVDCDYEIWRAIVSSKPEVERLFVQANTFRKGESVELKEYDASNEGIIQSWIDRAV